MKSSDALARRKDSSYKSPHVVNQILMHKSAQSILIAYSGPGSLSCRDIFTLENLVCAPSGRRACSNWISGISKFTLLRLAVPLVACG